ncbi:hypothetical protein C8F04DRAFT_1261766 [Mycena alexandri]|uniref:Histone-lysine N-methyltransferase n=1 Tax=Mycena alexandri TaxID=1745969 RepID=A0AAD6S8L0_9AGAR|nr:hypothetical protein C8F04DRAFT_1274135 [Mycena alexandri]KAJ7032686.1 hypothetical protein C8F04DRAFT_1261766 [Mycena alexandri]
MSTAIRYAAGLSAHHPLKAENLDKLGTEWPRSDWARYTELVRGFTRDELGAPPLRVVNNTGEEACAPFADVYSNHVWLHSSVGNIKQTKAISSRACDCSDNCVGGNCACVKMGSGYTSTGQPVNLDNPLYECGVACACVSTCGNRIVQQGRTVRIEVRYSGALKGWGLHADEDIPTNTFLFVFGGELVKMSEARKRPEIEFQIDLHFHHLAKAKYVLDAHNVGNLGRCLNHSCDPNTVAMPCYFNQVDLNLPIVAFFAKRAIKSGEQICIAYWGLDDTVLETAMGRMPCNCGADRCAGFIAMMT